MSERLPDKLESNGRVEVRVDGVVVGTRRIIDFVSSGGNADDGGLNDKVSVDTSGFGGGGTDLWQYVAGVLQPVTAPDEFLVTGSDTISDLDLDGVNGDLNSTLKRDFNLNANRDVNVEAGAHKSGSTLAGDVNIQARTGTGVSHGDMNLAGGRDVNVNATRDLNLSGTHLIWFDAKVTFSGQVSATGPVGTVIGKVPVYNGSATLVGYMPVYDTIT